MAEIHQFPKTSPDLDVIGVLEELLQRAKSGDIISVMIATIAKDGSYGTAHKGDEVTTGQMLLATRDLMKRIEEFHDSYR